MKPWVLLFRSIGGFGKLTHFLQMAERMICPFEALPWLAVTGLLTTLAWMDGSYAGS
jgi:hypothetical protein